MFFSGDLLCIAYVLRMALVILNVHMSPLAVLNVHVR